jgi:hypothetical protein
MEPSRSFAKRRPPAPLDTRLTGGRHHLSEHCQDRDDEGDYEDQPQEVVDRYAPDDREEHQQNDQ